nr:hypothetical protein [Tanacetum cinerariifolium]
QKHAAAGVLAFIEGEGDADPANEVRARMTDARHYRLALNRNDAVDLFADRRGVAVVVQRQQLQQDFTSVGHQRHVVQRQVRDQAPDHPVAQRHAHRCGGFTQATNVVDHRIDDRRAIELEVVTPDVLRQARQTVVQVVVGKVEIDLDLFQCLARQDAAE